MDKRILPLTLGGLAIGTTEFVIMALLPDVAKSLNISIPQAGHFISSYAAGVVVGAPILVAYAAKFPPKRILIFLMIAFTIFNGLSALSNDYYTMMILRFMSGLPHGAFFGVGIVVSSRLAKPGKQAQSIAMMFAGLTLANLAMVPFVTWLGHQLSWRYAFGVVSLIGLITGRRRSSSGESLSNSNRAFNASGRYFSQSISGLCKIPSASMPSSTRA